MNYKNKSSEVSCGPPSCHAAAPHIAAGAPSQSQAHAAPLIQKRESLAALLRVRKYENGGGRGGGRGGCGTTGLHGWWRKHFRSFLRFWPFGRFWSFLAVFWIIFDIFGLCILKFVFKRSIFLQRKILEARFWTPNSIFSSSFFQTSGRNFERSTRNSNVRPEIRTFDRKFQLPPNFSDVPFLLKA